MSENNWGGHRENSGRKKIENKKKQITVTLPEDQLVELKYRAELSNKTVGEVICDFLNDTKYNKDETKNEED